MTLKTWSHCFSVFLTFLFRLSQAERVSHSLDLCHTGRWRVILVWSSKALWATFSERILPRSVVTTPVLKYHWPTAFGSIPAPTHLNHRDGVKPGHDRCLLIGSQGKNLFCRFIWPENLASPCLAIANVGFCSIETGCNLYIIKQRSDWWRALAIFDLWDTFLIPTSEVLKLLLSDCCVLGCLSDPFFLTFTLVMKAEIGRALVLVPFLIIRDNIAFTGHLVQPKPFFLCFPRFFILHNLGLSKILWLDCLVSALTCTANSETLSIQQCSIENHV